MRLFDIPVLRQGNVIELMPLNSLETKKLEVVEACSGIRSLMTLMTLAVVFAYFSFPRPSNGSGENGDGPRKRRRFSSLRTWGFWRSTLLVVWAVPIAILTNALRVSGTGVLASYYGVEIADGFFHSFSGWVIYIVAFVLLFAFAWGLDRLHSLFSNDSRAALEQIDSLQPPIAAAPPVTQSEGAD
jgi:exosortase/archaeosortase family protein